MLVLRFLALIGALVLVHEWGHFLAARLFNVKVLKFSLGFGPRILGLRWRETDYCISLLPFGGFVKMLGEDPDDRVPPQEEHRAFHHQSVWRRFVIVLAGPLMSLLFPAFLYFVVYLNQRELTPPVLGLVVPGLPAEGRLQAGDRVLSINGREITSFGQVRDRIAESPGQPLRFRVERQGATVETTVTPVSVRVEQPLDQVEYLGRAGVSAGFPLAVVAVRPGVNAASRMGLRTFDLVVSLAGRPVHRLLELERSLASNHGATVPVVWLRPEPVNAALGGLCDLEIVEPHLGLLTPDPGEGDVPTRTGIESPDLYVADVPARSAEHEMGLRRGDRILTLDGVAPASFEAFRDAIVQGGTHRHELLFRREGREIAGSFALRPAAWTDEFGQRYTRLSFRTEHWLPAATEAPVPNPSLLLSAARGAGRETVRALRFMSLTLVRLVQGRLSLSTVGGPLMIYDASRSTASDGWDGFLWLMALVSVNLGLLNLLPIPTLDGGHLLFLGIEAAARRPVPLRLRQVLSALGMLLLLTIMGLALKNDLQRRFGRSGTALPLSAELR